MRRIPFLLVALASAFTLTGTALGSAARTAVSPSNSSLPTISGTARVGQTLTAASGTWNGSTPLSYAYQWQRCNSSGSGCGTIGGASNQNYVASSGDGGKTLRVQVTASNADGSNQALSAATATIATTGAAPASTKQPNPGGKAEDGQTVTVDNGNWSGQNPITFTYQWQSCIVAGACTDITGATGRSYLVVTSEVGSELRATVTATNPVGTTSTFSNLTAVVIAKTSVPLNTSLPVISGSLTVGQTLQASTGVWSGLGTSPFAYQWSRCDTNGSSCASISGATGQSYGVGQVDLGNALRVNVTATNSTGATSALSAASVIAVKTTLAARVGAVLRASQEVRRPKGTSSHAAGRLTAKITGKTLSWSLTFSHLSGRAVSATLNRGLRGVSGASFRTLCRNCSASSHGTLTLTASQVDALIGGGAYVNIHTVRNPAGEIRGQINRVS